MHGLLAAFVAIPMLFRASEAAGAQRTRPKQHSSSNPVVQTEAPQRTIPGQSTRFHRASDRRPAFRAEDIVPDFDVCRGHDRSGEGPGVFASRGRCELR